MLSCTLFWAASLGIAQAQARPPDVQEFVWTMLDFEPVLLGNINSSGSRAVPRYIAALAILLLLGIVLTRVWLMRRQGIKAVHFGNIDKTDFLIPPFAIFYVYLVLAATFDLPRISSQEFFDSEASAWIGAVLCVSGILLLFGSVISFGRSFRVGIDVDHPDKLVTTGVFALSRNPIYVAFAMVLIGELLVCPNWIFLVYTAAAAWLIHRQVLREEEYLKSHYGAEYSRYCQRVRRYL